MNKQALREKLGEEIDRVSIKPLLPHFERQALWLLDDQISLVDAGLAVISDDSEQVGAWIKSERLRKPREEEINSWTDDILAQHFEFLIVQPYVLAIVHQGGEADWRADQAPKKEGRS
jgi:hypothetical protein